MYTHTVYFLYTCICFVELCLVAFLISMDLAPSLPTFGRSLSDAFMRPKLSAGDLPLSLQHLGMDFFKCKLSHFLL